MKLKHLIYISYYFPPIHSIAVLRNYFLVTHLKDELDHIEVLTTQNQNIFPQSPMDIEGINIKKLATWDYRTLIHFFKKDKSKLHFDESTKKSPLIKFFIKLNETLPFSLLMGEGGLIYIISGVRYASKYLKDNKKAIIMTPYRPTANVVMGYLLKLIQPQITWVVSMHDLPYIYRRANCYFPKLQRFFWKKFFNKADKVFTLSHGLADEFKTYGIDVPAIFNGVIIRQPVSQKNETFTFLFTGSLYDGLINPLLFFQCVENLLAKNILDISKVQIIYAGKDSQRWLSYAHAFLSVSHITKVYDVVPHGVALEMQLKSNVNLLLTWNDDNVKGILTGKFFEYLGARNPILTLLQGSLDNDFEPIFSELKCGKIVYTTDPEACQQIEDFIIQKYMLWSAGNYDSVYTSSDLLTRYSWPLQVDKLWKLIKDL